MVSDPCHLVPDVVSCCLIPQYIQWRYAIGEDRESLSKVSRVATEEDQKSLDAVHGAIGCQPSLMPYAHLLCAADVAIRDNFYFTG